MEQYFVALDGNDRNRGTKDSPFASLDRAKEAAKGRPAVIYLRGGRYFFRKPLALGPENNHLRIQAWAGEPVYFDGGVWLDPGSAKPFRDGIMMIDLAPYDIVYGRYGTRGFRRPYVPAPNELFVNGEPYRVSRYPKTGMIPLAEEDILDSGSRPAKEEYDLRPAVIRWADCRLEHWKDAKDAYLAGFPCQSWADDCIRIAHIDTKEHTITTALPHLYGYAATGHSGWYIVNLLAEVTEPGEYFVDIHEKKLYFIPKGNLADAKLQLSSLDQVMISVENAEDIQISGITFENSRSGGVYIAGGEGCVIQNCVFRNLGTLAVQIGQGASPMPDGLHTCHGKRAPGIPAPRPISREMGAWHEYLYEFAAWDNCGGKNHRIAGCTMQDLGAGGVLLSGGNRKTLEPSGNTVENCRFSRVNRLDKTYKAAVNVMGVGNRIAHCEISDLPGMAIYLHGNDHCIEYNRIHHVLQEVSDSGAIYMGRDMSEVGNIIRYNFIYSIHNPVRTGLGVCAVYFDDWSVYNMVYANCFYDIVSDGKFFFSTIYHTCGGLTSIGNNILIDCFPGLNPNQKSNAYLHMHTDPLSVIRARTSDPADLRGVDITSAVYRQRYPYLYKTYTQNYNPGTKFWHNRVYVRQYDDFADPAALDFTLKESAEFLQSNMPEYTITDDVFGLDNETVEIINIPFAEIGILNQEETI